MIQFSFKQLGYFFGTLLLLALIFIGRSEVGRRIGRSAVQPFVSGADYVIAQGRRLFGQMDELSEENQHLESELSALKLELQEVRTLRAENEQLRRAIGMEKRPQWKIIQAEVLTRDPVVWNLQFSINRGRKDGVELGACVLFDNILVGRISEVSEHSAMVETVLSPTCRLGVMLEKSSTYGLLRGTGRGGIVQGAGCIVEYLPLSVVASPEEKVLTSGLGDMIPPGIPIAMIQADAEGRTIREAEHAQLEINASPLAKLDELRFVSVVILRP